MKNKRKNIKRIKEAITKLRNQGEIAVTGRGINELHLPMGVKTGVFDDMNKTLKRIISRKSIAIKLNNKQLY